MLETSAKASKRDMRRAYTLFLERSALLDDDRESLRRKRGLDDATVDAMKFRSGGNTAKEALASLRSDVSDEALVASGLYVDPGADSENSPGENIRPNPKLIRNRILIPYLRVTSKVAGQIHTECVHLRPHKDGFKKHKSRIYDPSTVVQVPMRGSVVLVEGEFGGVALAQLGFYAISVPGVSSFVSKRFSRLVKWLKDKGSPEVCIAFDSEDKSNPSSRKYKLDPTKRWATKFYAYRLAKQLSEEGFVAKIATLPLEWDPDRAKVDADSALAAGRTREDFEEVFERALRVEDYLSADEHETRITEEGRGVIVAEAGCWLTKAVAGRVPPRQYADVLNDAAHWFARPSADGAPSKLYVYHDGVYGSCGEGVARKLAFQLLGKGGWTIHRGKEVVAALRQAAVLSVTDVEERLNIGKLDPTDSQHMWINLRNGWLNWKTDELRPHDPKVLSTVQLPISHAPDAQCPEIDARLAEILPVDCVALFWELAGYLLIPSARHERAFLFVGPAGSGKTTLVELLMAALGRENVSSASLQALTNGRFGLASVVDKLANVGDDIPSTCVEDSSSFKKIVSGVRMEAEEKHRQPFPFTPTARLICTANRIPDSVDDTNAWFDRWLVVPCERVFRGASDEVKRDDLIGGMTTHGELSGYLNRALGGLHRLDDRGGFAETETTRRMKQRMVGETESSALRFLRECCVSGEGRSVPKALAWQAYRRWCVALGEEKPRRRDWNAAVSEMPGVREDRNSQQRVWKGIALNDEGERYRWMEDGIGFRQDGFR